MKKIMVLSFIIFTLLASSAFGNNLLTGNARLACEAILCLSSPTRPAECLSSLEHFFGIKKKKWKDTVKARQNFLNLCPSSSESDVMLSLTNAIAYGAGKCDAANLNQNGRWINRKEKLPASSCRGKKNIRYANVTETWQLISEKNSSYVGSFTPPSHCVHTLRYWQVDTNPPGYCTDLWEHQYTYYVNRPVLVRGQNPWDIQWVEPKK